MNTLLEVKALNKTYTTGAETQQILKDVDISINAGEFAVVMGASGSGKSTLLYTVSGMERPESGSVLFDGHQLAELKEEKLSQLRLSSMGFVFQQPNLLKNLTILDNIILGAYLSKKETRTMVAKRAKKLMEHMGILELANHDITQVSGGQLQRAAVCRALINNPKILFGDEPTGALNASATADVMDILENIHQSGTTILLVTHDARVAARSERVLFMADGRIRAEKRLETYKKDKCNLKQREAELSAWLVEQGF